MAEMEEIAVLIDNGVLTLGFNRPEKETPLQVQCMPNWQIN